MVKKNPGKKTTKEKKKEDFTQFDLPFEEFYTDLEKSMKWVNRKVSGSFSEKVLCRQLEQKVKDNHFNLIFFGHTEG